MEPTGNLIMEQDSIFSGEFWGIRIGSTHEDVYDQIRQIRIEKKIRSVEVADNFFTLISELDTRIPLYNSLRLDEPAGTVDGVQIYFADNKIKSIYLNSGKSLIKWPADAATNSSIQTGDATGVVYEKLVAASKLDKYRNKFDRAWLISKNLSADYDDRLNSSALWYFGSPASEKKGYQVFLKFEKDKLSSIHYNLILAL
jgi:hypothetical protein